MADEEENTTPEEQALADEWAAALAEAGESPGQDDIDALMNQGAAPRPLPPIPVRPWKSSAACRAPTRR